MRSPRANGMKTSVVMRDANLMETAYDTTVVSEKNGPTRSASGASHDLTAAKPSV
eukprot:CAMPEP_0171084052 /NCGR_PEP_ID=MMETSP0766_2-20121228/18082_1 /TAXON_ID=439317 /ORGANISM="Gambierdiscus australes, Strain CAWD 149" /LENGTH=54 /DNA_ID=CAMNT_0011541531 /DNA_START=524 /DNA_END=688 /DNA_ORIENTATION=-